MRIDLEINAQNRRSQKEYTVLYVGHEFRSAVQLGVTNENQIEGFRCLCEDAY